MKLRFLLWCACLERMHFDCDFDLGYLNVFFLCFHLGCEWNVWLKYDVIGRCKS